MRYEEQAGFPQDIRAHRLTLIAYGAGRQVLDEKCVESGSAEESVELLLANKDALYLHVRDTEAGCYDFTIEKDSLQLLVSSFQ
jgi:hypothetical protein